LGLCDQSPEIVGIALECIKKHYKTSPTKRILSSAENTMKFRVNNFIRVDDAEIVEDSQQKRVAGMY